MFTARFLTGERTSPNALAAKEETPVLYAVVVRTHKITDAISAVMKNLFFLPEYDTFISLSFHKTDFAFAKSGLQFLFNIL